MKTIRLLNRSAWAAAALFVATTVLTGLTACAEKDVPAVTPDKQITQDLVGTWYGSYAQEETLTKYGVKHYIVKAEQALTFNADGTGICSKILSNAANEPITLFGGSKNTRDGRFHYTVGKDSVITITRDGDGDASNPKTWQLRFGTEGLTGTDGITPYELHSADEEWQAYIARQEERFNKTSGMFTAESTPSFLTDWQKCEDVLIEGIASPQYTPWYGPSNSDIGDQVRFDVQKEAGWEMAFCQLNDSHNKNARLFGLYNRFTGLLRVFSYVLDPGSQGYGNEMAYKFIADGSEDLPRYPFYNSMEYAIPVCHAYNDKNTFDKNATLITDQTSYKPFETMISAYTRHTEAIGVSAGWHCTDFDFSGFTEKGIDWAGPNPEENQNTLLTVQPCSQDQSKVLLTGSIVGDIKGTFEDPIIEQKVTGTTLSTITQLVGTLTSGYSGIFSTLGTGYGMQIATTNLRHNPNFVGPNNDTSGILGINAVGWLSVGGLIASGLGTAMKIVDQFAGKPEVEEIRTPGKINMTIDAKVDLSGTISSWKSINDAGVRITPSLLKQSQAAKQNGDTTMWMGSGCIGLAEDPIIYVSQEDLLSTSQSIIISKDGDNYKAPSFATDSVRLVSFLDPRSVKVCLNTDLYHDIDSVHVLINYGVNTNRLVSNTDCYRRMLKLGERPTFSLMPKDGTKKLTTLTIPRLHVMTKSDVLKKDFYTENRPDSVQYVYQTGSMLPFYGRFETFGKKRFVMDPQVFVPFDPNKDNSTVFAVTIPDFVVTVTVAFRCHEVPDGVFFSQAYIPKIELIGHNDIATFYEGLKDYSNKSLNNQSVGTIFNAPTIKVYDHSGEALLTKTLNILNKCK